MHQPTDSSARPIAALFPPRSVSAQSLNRFAGRNATSAWGCLLTGNLDVPRLQAVLPSTEHHFSFTIADLQAIPATHRSAALRQYVRDGFQRHADHPSGEIAVLRLDQTTVAVIFFFPTTLGKHWSPATFLHTWLTAYVAAMPTGIAYLAVAKPAASGEQVPLTAATSQPEQMEFWRNYLADFPAEIHLPTQQPRSATPAFQAARVDFQLAPALFDAVQTLSRQEGITSDMLVLAAFTACIMRYTGQPDFVVGVTPSTDPVSGTTDILPLRLNLAPSPTFRQLIHTAHAIMHELASHADRAFAAIAEAVFADRPYDYQLLFTCNQEPTVAITGNELRWHPLPLSETTVYFDLLLDLRLSATAVAGTLEYNADLFDAATIKRFSIHFHTLLTGLVSQPDNLITDIPLLTPAEMRQQLVEWNAATVPVPACGLHMLVADQTARTPDAIAVRAPDGDLTYAALNARANQLAHHLRQLGAGPERPIAICLQRTRPLLIALLGILKAGSAYVPLDPAYPADRLVYSLADSQSHLLITERRLQGSLPSGDTPTIFLDEIDAILDQQPVSEPAELTTPHNLAYIIYTSGSTGRPKGVAIEHHSAVALVAWALSVFTPAELRGVLAATSYCFDLSIFEMFVPLSCGGTVILANNVLALPTLAAREQVTLINTVPAAITELLVLGEIPPSVQTINLAGEPLAGDLVQRLYQQTRVGRIVNLYGPTEDTTYSTVAELDRADPRAPSIGQAIANSQAFILDDALNPVPIGVAGELFLAGEGVARGYLYRPDATAEKFLPHPFSASPGDRLYRTGDIAHWRPDGTIDFHGRVDHQVKIRGFRIELGEIEAILKNHPQVEQCLVLGREDFAGDKRLVAYVVAHTSITSGELGAFLQAYLPAYMIPADIVFLDAFPLTPNGKVDRRALPAPVRQTQTRSDDDTPMSPLEVQVARIWADILHVDSVGITDNFFALGGHSLLATRVVSRLRADTHIDVPLLAIFENPTIAQLASYIMSLADIAVSEQPIQPIPRDSQDLASVLTLIEQMTPEAISAFLLNRVALT